MTPAAWSELIDSYVSGRLSADSFKRRFSEAFGAAIARRAAVPASVQELAYVVDAYAGDPMARGHDVADDADLMRAARAALASIGAGATTTSPPPRPEFEGPIHAPVDPAEVEAQMRHAAGRIRTTMALGCGLGLAYLAIMALQVFAIADQVQNLTGIGAVLSSIAAVFLTFIPIVGGVIAYFGATDVWKWSHWIAGLLFIVAPFATLLLGWGQRAAFRVLHARGRR